LISVIISSYNRSGRLTGAIQSVINQTYEEWELIIVDDASTDDTTKVVKGFKDPRIKYFRLDKNSGNHGVVKNRGVRESNGKYLAFLDDDNVYRPDHLAVLLKAIDGFDVSYGDRMRVNESTGKRDVGINSDYNPMTLMNTNYIDTSDSLIRREAIEYIGGWDERYKRLLDWNLYVRLAKAGFTFNHVRAIITEYHIHSDGMLSENKPVDLWDSVDCEIRLPYLGKKPEKPKVAIFSITYDRLEYTNKCFKSLKDTAGYPYDHFVIDNGSTDGTHEYILDNFGNFIVNPENKGISIASNQALKLIGTDYDIIMKVDNDCLFLTDGWLKRMVEIWESNHMLALSCYVQGLRDNPGGAPRIGYGQIKGELLGMTEHLGGICHFVSAKAYDDFRWDEGSFLHGLQDLELSRYLLSKGYGMGYLENYFCEHIDGTEGQLKRYPDYFERRKSEKTTRPKRTYKEIQERESANSRGTPWGERVEDTIERYKGYIKGKVLDLGCGDGLGIEKLRRLGHEAQGLDISEEKVLKAREHGLNVKQGLMEELPFKDKEFDTVFCSHTLEHSSDAKKAVAEIKRVARRVIIVVPIENATNNPAHTNPFTSTNQLDELFSDSTIIHKEELNRMEREYVLIADI
jgi:glycosyltransferase involved in cell wall biosynthesis